MLNTFINNIQTFYKYYFLNFGPQHPLAHSVLRLVLDLHGKVITKANPYIEVLHRGIEKLMELKTVVQSLNYLNYVLMMLQKHRYLVIKKTLYSNKYLVLNSNFFLTEIIFQNYEIPKANFMFLFVMLLVCIAILIFIQPNISYFLQSMFILSSFCIAKIISNFVFNNYLLAPQLLNDTVGELAVCRSLACFFTLLFMVLVTSLLQLFNQIQYVSLLRYYKFWVILFLVFFDIPYLEFSLLLNTILASLSINQYLNFLNICSNICKSLQNRYIFAVILSAVLATYILSAEVLAASNAGRAGATAVSNPGARIARGIVEVGDPETLFDYAGKIVWWCRVQLDLVDDDPNVVSRRPPKLKPYNPLEHTCKKPEFITSDISYHTVTSKKFSEVFPRRARLRAEIQSRQLLNGYKLNNTQVQTISQVNNPCTFAQNNWIAAETKESYRRTTITADKIHAKLTSNQINNVFSQETKTNHSNKVISAGQVCNSLTSEQISKVCLPKAKTVHVNIVTNNK